MTILRTFLTIIILSFVWSGAASAQSKQDVRDMQKKIEALEKQLNAVQRKVFPGGDLAQDGKTMVVTEDRTAASGALLADMEVRIGQIETQMRLLTGRIEEVQHSQEVLERRLKNLSEDVDLRFRDLPGGGGMPGAAATGPATGVPGTGLVRTETPEQAQALLEGGNAADVTPLVEEPAAALPEGTPDDQYQFALAKLRRGDYPGAEQAFEAFLEKHAEHDLAGNAQYWLGESFYVRKDFPRAAAAFLKGYREHSDGPKGPDSLVKLGMSMGGMGKVAEACEIFAEVDARYPNAADTIRRTTASERRRLGCQ